MKFDKNKKRKFDGGGDRGEFKKRKWNKNPEQSGANATPLGDRSNGVVADSNERLPKSILQSHGQDNSFPKRELGEKGNEKKKKESQTVYTKSQENEHDVVITATKKFGTPREEKAKEKKGRHQVEDIANKSGVHYRLDGGIVDKDDAKALQSEHPAPDKRDNKKKKTVDLADKVGSKAEQRKASKKARSGVEKNARDVVQSTATGDNNEQPDKTEESAGSATHQKKERFICFVGQLPFTCTTEDIQSHFAKVQPNSIRHATHKDGDKSKGYAFLEFDNWDRMRTCLKLYHHSEFDDGKSKSRKINIELTSGGGGNSASRREKIGSKNEKLEEERKREYEKKRQEHSMKGGIDVGSSKEDDNEQRPKLSKDEKRAENVLTKKQKKMKAKQEKKSSRNAGSKKKSSKTAVEQMEKGSDYAGMDPSRAALMARQG